MNSWHIFFIEQARQWSTKSKDSSTKVGAIIVGNGNTVLSTGYNGFPRGVNDDVTERWKRPEKYLWVEHAERNAVYNAARIGVSLKGSTCYMMYEPLPCADCARALIQAGVKRIVGPAIAFPGHGELWKQSMDISREMLNEAGIELVEIETT